jgi:hypothetical protein
MGIIADEILDIPELKQSIGIATDCIPNIMKRVSIIKIVNPNFGKIVKYSKVYKELGREMQDNDEYAYKLYIDNSNYNLSEGDILKVFNVGNSTENKETEYDNSKCKMLDVKKVDGYDNIIVDFCRFF